MRCGPTTLRIVCLLGLMVVSLMIVASAAAGTSRSTMMTGLAEQSMGFDVISVGNHGHAAGMRTNGSVWVWGNNSSRQIGDNTIINRPVPVEVPALHGALSVLPGADFTIALMPDGRVLGFGDNSQGQLGDGTTAQRATPVQAVGMTGVRQVSVGDHHVMAIKADGTVWAWGRGAEGQLGDGANAQRSTPYQVTALTGARALELGENHSFAIMANGDVTAWGLNTSGQIGRGDTSSTNVPVTIAGLFGARQLAAGASHSVAIMSNGDVKTWGADANEQLGNGAAGATSTPTVVAALAGARSIAVGDSHSMATLANGSVVAWGNNGSGQLGLADTTNRQSPTPVPSLAGARFLSLGNDQSLAVSRTGVVLAAGSNTFGQLGDGSTAQRTSFVTSQFTCGCASFVKVIAGGYFSAGIKADGTTWTWGLNNKGQLGLGLPMNFTAHSTPQRLDFPGGRLVRDLYLGSYHAMAIMDDGTVWGWGQNTVGELGLGPTGTDQNVPVQLTGLTGARDIALSFYNSYVLLADGTVLASGENGSGEIGDGATTDRTSFVPVTAVDLARQIVPGRYSAFASMPNGNVRGWGVNDNGQLAVGTTTDATTPTLAPGLNGAREVAAGAYHSHTILSDGSLVAAGRSLDGELGLGDFAATRSTAAAVTAVGAVRSVSSGRTHVMIVNAAGQVMGTGLNDDGQLGILPATDHNVFTTVTSLGSIRDLSLGGYNSISLDTDGVFRTWGDNTRGQMGNGTNGAGVNATPDFVSSGCEEPAAPVIVNQYLADGTTPIATGGWAGTTVVFAFDAADPDPNETLTPMVEVTTGAFAPDCGPGPDVYSGAPISAPTADVPVRLTVTVTGLTPGAAYRWRACTSDKVDYRSAWVAHGGSPDFTIDGDAPLLPVLLAPGDGGSTPDTTPTFTATYADGTSQLSGFTRVRVGTSATCGTGVVEVGASGTTASGATASWTSPTLAAGTYYWCAQNEDAVGNVSAWTATRMVIVGAGTLDVGVSPVLDLGRFAPGLDVVGEFDITVRATSITGYQLSATDTSDTDAATCTCAGVLLDWTGTDATPLPWAVGQKGYGGITIDGATDGRLGKWGPGTGTSGSFAGLRSGSSVLLHSRAGYSANTDTINAAWRANLLTDQDAGTYTASIQITAVAIP